MEANEFTETLLQYLSGTARRLARTPPPPAYRKPFRLAVPALLALLVALAASPAAAQTTITLVSNTGQTDAGTGNLQDFDQAQAFTTGGNSAGYTLTGVDIEFAGVPSATESYDVSIRTDDSGSPGALVGALTAPATLVADAVNAYTDCWYRPRSRHPLLRACGQLFLC